MVEFGAPRTDAAGAAVDGSFDPEQDVLVVVFDFTTQGRFDLPLSGSLVSGLLLCGLLVCGVTSGFGGDGAWGGWGLGSSAVVQGPG
ncbi:MAG TPA: hypothetical protein PK428_11425, partial [Phycicoccus sp.]|nr:hypothetical protein [Phycicoccus sp.]